MFRIHYVVLALVAFLALNGCSSKKYKYRIAVIPKGMTHEFWQSIERGSRRAADDLEAEGISVQILWEGPAKEDDALEQISIINRKASMNIQGLVLAPQDRQQMVAPVERVVQRDIPVVIIDSDLDNADLYVKYVSTNNYNGGKLAAEKLLGILAAEGKTAPNLLLFRYKERSESTEQRERGFQDYVNQEIEKQKKAGKPTITWLSKNKYAGATVQTAQREASNLLSGLEDQRIDGIFAVNESAATGMLNALRSKKREKEACFIGFDSSEPLLQAVREGDVRGLIVQDPYRMGYMGVWTLVQHLEGYNVSPDKKTYSTGEHFLTRDNIDSKEMRELYDPEYQKQRTIKTEEYPKR